MVNEKVREQANEARELNKMFANLSPVLLELLESSEGKSISQELKVLSEELYRRWGKLEEEKNSREKVDSEK